MVAILNFFQNFNKDFYCPVKGYIGVKNEVYPQNRVRAIQCFYLRGNNFLSFLLLLNEETHVEDSDYAMYQHVMKKLEYTTVIMLSLA